MRTFLLLLISSMLVLTSLSSSASEQDFNPHENCPERLISQDLMPDNIFNGERAGTLGWCFAHSASDILSYKLGRKMSVHDVATYFLIQKFISKISSPGWSGFLITRPADIPCGL